MSKNRPAKSSSIKNLFKNLFSILGGIALIPACLGVLETLWMSIEKYNFINNYRFFLAGTVTYLVIFIFFNKPLRSYVFGHELTHAIATLLFKGTIKSFSASSSGGQVVVSKTNIIIVLAPYFFPFYTFIVMLIYFILSAFFQLEKFFNIMVFFLGFTWSFHLILTGYMLLKGQEDIQAFGTMFSLSFICLLNLVMLCLIMVFIAPQMTLENIFHTMFSYIRQRYLVIIS